MQIEALQKEKADSVKAFEAEQEAKRAIEQEAENLQEEIANLGSSLEQERWGDFCLQRHLDCSSIDFNKQGPSALAYILHISFPLPTASQNPCSKALLWTITNVHSANDSQLLKGLES